MTRLGVNLVLFVLIISECIAFNQGESDIININVHKTYGTNQLRHICYFSDITSKIMEFLTAGNCLNLGLCNKDNLKSFQAQTAELKEQTQCTDQLLEILSAKLDFIDRYLIKRRLHRIPCYLSSWNGIYTSMESVFPPCALNKMKTDADFRICRVFDFSKQTSYFGFIAGPWYLLFVLSHADGYGNVYYAQSQNESLTQVTFINLLGDTTLTFEQSNLLSRIAAKSTERLGDFLLDYHAESLSIYQQDMKKMTRCSLSQWIKAAVLLIVALSPSLIFFFPLPLASKPLFYVAVVFFSTFAFHICYHPIEEPRNINPWIYLTLLLSAIIWYLVDFFMHFPVIRQMDV